MLATDYEGTLKQIAGLGYKANIKHCFIEQEAYDIPPLLQALKIDADYLSNLKV